MYRGVFRIIGIGILISLPTCNFHPQSRPDSAQIVLISATEGGTVASSDGRVTLEIPAGALSEDAEISIAPVPPEDIHEELMALAEAYGGSLPNASAYRLQPDGLEFEQPVTIRFEDGPDAIQDSVVKVFVLLTQSGNGEPEFVDELESTANLEAGTVVVSGQLTHFSWLVRSDLGLEARLEQIEPKEQPVGASFNITIKLENKTSANRIQNIKGTLSTTNPVEILGYSPRGGAIEHPTSTRLHLMASTLLQKWSTNTSLDLKCTKPGNGSYTYYVEAEEAFGVGSVTSPSRYPTRPILIRLDAVVRCFAPTPTPTPTATPTEDPVAAMTLTALAQHSGLEYGLLDRGIQLYDANDLEGALIAFANVLEEYPQNKEAYYNIGVIRIDLGEYILALEAFRQAIAIDPTYDLALYGRALVGVQVGDDLEKQLSSWIGFLEHHPQADEMRAFANLQVANLLVAIDVESQITPPPPTEQAPTQAPPEEPTQEPVSEE